MHLCHSFRSRRTAIFERRDKKELTKYSSFQIDTEYITVPYSDIEAQRKALEECRTKKIDGIILSPINTPEIVEEINQCEKSGIPVITVNTDIKGSNRLCYIGQDGFKAGMIAGRLMGEFLHGEGKVVLFSSDGDEHQNIKLICYENYPEILKQVQDGIITATLDSEIEEQGRKSMDVLMEYLVYDRKPARKHLYSETKILLKESL